MRVHSLDYLCTVYATNREYEGCLDTEHLAAALSLLVLLISSFSDEPLSKLLQYEQIKQDGLSRPQVIDWNASSNAQGDYIVLEQLPGNSKIFWRCMLWSECII